MDRTKYDLCSDTVTLDYDELLTVAQSAVYYGVNAVSKRITNIQVGRATSLDAKWLVRDAHNLARAITAVHYLTKGKDRPTIIVLRDE